MCENEGRNPDEISVVAVTKGFNVEAIRLAREFGFKHVGENRVKKGIEKMDRSEELSEALNWHMIGHVQSNKVKHLIGKYDLIHSVDRRSLIDELEKRLKRNEQSQRILVQVNTSGESSKHGVPSEEAEELFEEVLETETLEPQGLMTIAPYTDDENCLRETFAKCRDLRDKLEDTFGIDLPELSMGMTNDYAQAIREGSTMLRLGRALFGERPD